MLGRWGTVSKKLSFEKIHGGWCGWTFLSPNLKTDGTRFYVRVGVSEGVSSKQGSMIRNVWVGGMFKLRHGQRRCLVGGRSF